MPERVRALRLVALAAALIAGLLPATAAVELFPLWDLDPTTAIVPSTGIGPALRVGLAVIALLAAAAAVLADVIEGRAVLWLQAVLAGVGAAGVVVHGLGGAPGIEHAVYAAPWLALAAAWLTTAHLCRDADLRAVTLAVLFAMVVPLLAKGALQVVVDHPATVADFARNKNEILAAQGWSPGSSNALAYERRLMQAEASGWFGLSNVYATFAAAAAAGMVALTFSARSGGARCVGARSDDDDRARGRLGLVWPVLLAVVALIALALSRSKGGVGAFALAVAAMSMIAVLARVRPAWLGRVGPFIGPGVVAGVLAILLIRGLIGEGLGERSLLFRSQYITGALRIWAEHPFTGVGPAGFQDAYATAKPALSPETVQSPHSILFDWTATLGVFGLGWAAWLIWQSTRLVSVYTATASEPASAERSIIRGRDAARFAGLVVAAVGLVSAALARELASPSFLASTLVGLAGWVALALPLITILTSRTAARAAAAGTAVALLAHAQIEVTPVWVNASPLAGLWLGAACANHPRRISPEPTSRTGHRALGMVVVAGLFVLAVFLAAAPFRAARAWESSLVAAAEILRPAADARTGLADLERADDPMLPPIQRQARAESLAAALSIATGRPVPARVDAMRAAADGLRFSLLEPAASELNRAIAARPAHLDTTRAQGRLLIEIAARVADDDRAAAMLDAALAAASAARNSWPTASAIDWHAAVLEQSAALLEARGRPDMDGRLARAFSEWVALADRTPHAVRPVIRAMDLAVRLQAADAPGRDYAAAAADLAAEALRRDTFSRLDPLAGLTDAERARATRLARPDASP